MSVGSASRVSRGSSSFYSRSHWRGDARRRMHSRGLDEDTGARAVAEDVGEPLGGGADAPRDQFALSAQDADLTFHLVHVDANLIHGWPPSACGVDRGSLCGAAYATTLSWGSATSADLRSAAGMFTDPAFLAALA